MRKSELEALADALNDRLAVRSQAINNGVPKDFPAYREVVGVIQGLNIALDEIKVLSRDKMEDGDNE